MRWNICFKLCMTMMWLTMPDSSIADPIRLQQGSTSKDNNTIHANAGSAFEPFIYNYDTSLLGKNSGSGFNGPWTGITPYDDYYIGLGSLTYDGKLPNRGHRITSVALTGHLGSIGRDLITPIGTPGTTCYLSFIVRPEGFLNFGEYNGFFGLLINDSVFIGKPGSGNINQFSIEDTGGAQQYSSGVEAVVNEEFLLVVRAEFSEGNDRFTLYVNPVPGEAEPAIGTVKNDRDVGISNRLTIYSTGAFSLDEIRIGGTYEEVVPTVTKVYEGVNYTTVGSALQGADGGYGFLGPWLDDMVYFDYSIGAGSLSYMNVLTEGNRITSGSLFDHIAIIHRENSVWFGTPGTTYYLSFIIRPEGILNQGIYNGFFGLLLNNFLFIGKPGDGAINQFVLEKRGGAYQHSSGIDAVVDEEFLLVVRMDFSAGNDLFTLYVNPVPGQPEPAIGTMKNDMDVGYFSILGLYSTGAFSIDEIRIGVTYSEVVPTPGVPLADFDNDGDVDISDYMFFSYCLSGPNNSTIPPGLSQEQFDLADIDDDNDVDMADYVLFMLQFAGEGL